MTRGDPDSDRLALELEPQGMTRGGQNKIGTRGDPSAEIISDRQI